MAPGQMIARFLTLLMVLSAGTVRNHVSTQDWVLYRNAATGVAFRYPPSLRVHERDVQEFGLLDAELIVDLVGDTEMNPGTVVLRFIVHRGLATPQKVAARSRSLRGSCKSLTSMPINGHQALVCVYTGRAAIHWRLEVLDPRECTIVSELLGADSYEADPPPHDGTFPLLSIIKTLHFELPKK
jgi:hypothetical protein